MKNYLTSISLIDLWGFVALIKKASWCNLVANPECCHNIGIQVVAVLGVFCT